ncbi:MAG: hypothetical protein ABSH32_03035 [Bryobacteraceae bacterium]
MYRKTIGKRMAAKLKQIRQKQRQGLHERIKDTTEWLQSVVRGYSQYHAVPRNEERLKAFRHEVLRMWWWPLRRRIQRTRWTWNKFWETFGNLLPEVEILHPYPEDRFAWQHIQGKNRVR